MSIPSRQSGFTLVEVTLLLVMIGLLLGGAIKGYQIYRNSLLQSVFSTMKEYEQAAVQFKTTYRFWPGDFRYATTNLVGCTAGSMNASTLNGILTDDCEDGDGDQSILGNSPWLANDYEYNIGDEQFQFIRHMALASLLDKNLLAVDGLTPSTALGGVIYARSLLETGFSDPGVHLILSGEASDGFYPVFTPREASYIDAKFDDGRPGFGKLKFRGSSGLDNDDAVDTCTNSQIYRPTDSAKHCMMGMRINE